MAREKKRLSIAKIILIAAAAVLVLVVAGFFIARLSLENFLRSENFRRLVSDATGRLLQARGEYQPIRFSGTTAYSDAFTAEDGAFFSQLRAEQVRAAFNPGGIFERAIDIEQLNVTRLQMTVRKKESGQVQPEPVERSRGGWSFTPNRVELKELLVSQANIEWGDAERHGLLRNVVLVIRPEGESWLIEGQGGELAQTGWPALELRQIKLRYREPTLFVTSGEFGVEEGSVKVSGEIDFQRTLDLRLELHRVSTRPFLSDDWRARLAGKVSGDVHVTRPVTAGANDEQLRVAGTISLADGTLEALPVLNQIATFTRTQRFRTLQLTEAKATFVQSGERLVVHDFIAESEGLIRMEGSFVVENGMITGAFDCGVTPASLQWLPGSQTKVFTTSRDGYLWTTLRVSGPLNNPSEDLTPRLIAAAQGAVIESVDETLRDSTRKVLDLLDPLLR